MRTRLKIRSKSVMQPNVISKVQCKTRCIMQYTLTLSELHENISNRVCGLGCLAVLAVQDKS